MKSAAAKRASAKYQSKVRAVIREAKNVPCADCGIRYPSCVMDFDHVRGEKKFTIGPRDCNMVGMVEEIAKCEVVCSNCHRIRTHLARVA